MGVLSGFCTRPRIRRIALGTWADDEPLETVGNRSAPMGCGPNWTRPATHGGPGGLDQAPWSGVGVVGPARPGRPTCGLPDDQACYHLGAQVDQFMAGARRRSRSMRHPSATMSLPTTVLPREPRGSNPAPCCFAVRGRSGECRATSDSGMPAVTARARRGPAVSDAVRTQRGPELELDGATGSVRPPGDAEGAGTVFPTEVPPRRRRRCGSR
jgi:hypothetical protein